MSGLSLETCTSNLNSVALTVLELLAFNVQKFRGSREPGYAPFRKIRILSALSLETLTSNLKSLALTVFELLTRGGRSVHHRSTHHRSIQHGRFILRTVHHTVNSTLVDPSQKLLYSAIFFNVAFSKVSNTW